MTPPRNVPPWLKKAKAETDPSKKKIKSQRPVKYDIEFDSMSELHFYDIMLQVLGSGNFDYQHYIELLGPAIHTPPKRKRTPRPALLEDRGIEAITLTVDFRFTYDGIEYFCDVKPSKNSEARKNAQRTGRKNIWTGITSSAQLRYEILKRQLYDAGRAHETRILFITMSEVKMLHDYAFFAKDRFWTMFKQLKER